jgi:hypothetical protein
LHIEMAMGSDSSSRIKINNPFADRLQLSADAELIVMGNPINEDADADAEDSSPDVEEGKAAGGVCRVCNETLRVYTETHPCFREIGDLDDWGCDVCGETLGRDTALHCCETFNECDWAACADCLLLPTQSTGAGGAFVADAGKEMKLDPPLIMVATQGLEGAALREAPALDAPTVQQGLLEPGMQLRRREWLTYYTFRTGHPPSSAATGARPTSLGRSKGGCARSRTTARCCLWTSPNALRRI